MELLTNCPICSFGIDGTNFTENTSSHTFFIHCQRCGDYVISDEMMEFRDTTNELQSNSARLSGLIRYFTDNNLKEPHIFATTINDLLENPLIPNIDDIEKKANLLMSALKRMTTTFGKELEINLEKHRSLAFAEDSSEFYSLLEYLKGKGYISENRGYQFPGSKKVKLTAEGFKFENKIESSKQIFIACWFDDSQDSAIKKTEEAILSTGYTPMCIKDKQYSDPIMEKGLAEIQKSRAIVADLTGVRAAVIYEAAYANALNIQIIYVRNANDKTKEIDFYTGNYKINFYQNLEELHDIVAYAINARFPLKR